MDYKCKEGMIDNRKVSDNHQQGIARKVQRKGDTTRADVEGHNGKMGRNIPSLSNWKRGDSLTPRKA
jgi:hypothetical protein